MRSTETFLGMYTPYTGALGPQTPPSAHTHISCTFVYTRTQTHTHTPYTQVFGVHRLDRADMGHSPLGYTAGIILPFLFFFVWGGVISETK